MIGRTLMQAAVPTTFGLKAAVWLAALDASDARLERAAGRLATAVRRTGRHPGLGRRASVRPFARRWPPTSGCRRPRWPGTPTERRCSTWPAALAITSAAVATPALDVVLLAQTEVGEVTEGTAGRGGSSSMAHKHNPIAAISARACAFAGARPDRDSLIAGSAQEHERAAGAWQAEWETLSDLLRLVGSGAAWLADSLSQLQVHAEIMGTRALKSLADNGSADPQAELELHVQAAADRVDDALAERSAAAS